jgi:hypothetical protein
MSGESRRVPGNRSDVERIARFSSERSFGKTELSGRLSSSCFGSVRCRTTLPTLFGRPEYRIAGPTISRGPTTSPPITNAADGSASSPAGCVRLRRGGRHPKHKSGRQIRASLHSIRYQCSPPYRTTSTARPSFSGVPNSARTASATRPYHFSENSPNDH